MIERVGGFLRNMRPLSSRRIDVRRPGVRPGATSPTHQSFRMTRSVRKAAIQHAFGKFVPKAFEAAMRRAKPSETTDKDIAYARRQQHSDRVLQTSEEQLRYERGLLKAAHAIQAEEKSIHLREGLNPAGHEAEQARRELQSFRASQKPPDEKKRMSTESQPNPLEAIRARLGIQHSVIGGAAPAAPAWQAPIRLGDHRPPSNEPPPGSGWTSQPSSQPKGQMPTTTPAFGAPAAGLTGGRVTLPQHSHEPIGQAVPPPPEATIKPEKSKSAPLPTDSDNTKLPDTSQVHDLPI